MNYRDVKIIFMGTPEFAVTSLEKLVDAGCNIVAVITAPDKAAGRGMQLQQSAVKKYALEKDINILQPNKLKDPEFLQLLRSLHADIQVVVAFRMLPEIVWNMPPLGTINLHGSLLPDYRGAAPINWAIINGEKFTGVTTFKLKQEIDTGDILLKEKIPIANDETAGELHDKMKVIGADLLLKTILGIADNTLTGIPQTSNPKPQTSNPKPQTSNSHPQTSNLKPLHHAAKIFTENCMIDWNRPVEEVYNLVRGLSPVPASFTTLEKKKLKIYKGGKIIGKPSIEPGIIDTDGKNYLRFACIDGYIDILDLQLEGKKRMEVKDFLRGYRFGVDAK